MTPTRLDVVLALNAFLILWIIYAFFFLYFRMSIPFTQPMTPNEEHSLLGVVLIVVLLVQVWIRYLYCIADHDNEPETATEPVQ